MEFLGRILGTKVIYKKGIDDLPLPNYIYTRYVIKEVSLDGIKTCFVYPKIEIDSITSIANHLEKIRIVTNSIPVLILSRLTYRQKEYLIKNRIPFVVEGKQVYLPFMSIYLQERCDRELNTYDSILPSTQLLFLYYIYQGGGEILTSDAARDLKFSPMSISRASNQLEKKGFINVEKKGINKVMSSTKTPRQLFEETKDSLLNPIKRIVYVPKKEVKDSLLMGGYSALSEYSLLNPPSVICFASDSISKWNNCITNNLLDINDQYEIEFWRYNPQKLVNGNSVDRLSLALALKDDKDERVEEAVEKMLEQVWREIDGKRN